MTEGFHRLDFRVHSHATEEAERVRQALSFISGEETPAVERAQGHYGNPITIFTARLRRDKDIRAFWERVKAERQLARVLAELERRVDGDGHLFLRFDKQEAYQGRMKLVRHDDVVSMKGKVAAYPSGRERAVSAARSYLEGV